MSPSSARDGRDAAQQPVLFMGTQTENLDYLYELVHELSAKMQDNKALRAVVLEDIDVLARRANAQPRDAGSRDPSSDANVHVIQHFIDRRSPATSPSPSPTGSPPATLDHVTAQNRRLRDILRQQQRRNSAALHALRHHDAGLHTCVALLRNEIYAYHVTILSDYRELATRLHSAEDAQFQQYLESVSDLQQLLDLCQVYRTILRLHP